ncbi:hypothetical protein ABZX12_18470 [Kribbella sp. NPDC003505]|uniref:hypothetical protein n=1 Tax=Kribbella sp. NPDC003505 TaxID=3154448 RepID=UPI0033BC972F
MSTTTDANASTKPADRLAQALNDTGVLIAKPVENGLAVRVESRMKHRKATETPLVTVTVWLPDEDLRTGYVWTAPMDHQVPPETGVDMVVAAIIATLLPKAAQ